MQSSLPPCPETADLPAALIAAAGGAADGQLDLDLLLEAVTEALAAQRTADVEWLVTKLEAGGKPGEAHTALEMVAMVHKVRDGRGGGACSQAIHKACLPHSPSPQSYPCLSNTIISLCRDQRS
jgi:hypothetical protein